MSDRPPPPILSPSSFVSYDMPDAICSICGMRRSDPKHRGRQADRCSKIRLQRSARLATAKP